MNVKSKAQKPRISRMKREKSTSTVGHYVRNADLLPAVLEAKEMGVVTEKLISMIWRIAERYSSKHNFARYSFREDMVSVAVANLCKNALKFNPEKSSNPFSFYTSAIHNSFLQYMAEEKNQRNIRDALLMDAGANPSFNFLEREKDEKDFEISNSDYHEYSESASDKLLSADHRDESIVIAGSEDSKDREILLTARQKSREPSVVVEYRPDQYSFDPETGQLTILVDRSAELITPSQILENKKATRKKAAVKKAAVKKAAVKKAAVKKAAVKKAAPKRSAK